VCSNIPVFLNASVRSFGGEGAAINIRTGEGGSKAAPGTTYLRAKIVLACEREPSNAVVATRLGVGPHTIGKWHKRFIADRNAQGPPSYQIEGLSQQ
jgi:hypothetical protein